MKLVRAINPVTGAHFTTSKAHAKASGLKYSEAANAATDRFDRVRPPVAKSEKDQATQVAPASTSGGSTAGKGQG